MATANTQPSSFWESRCIADYRNRFDGIHVCEAGVDY